MGAYLPALLPYLFLLRRLDPQGLISRADFEGVAGSADEFAGCPAQETRPAGTDFEGVAGYADEFAGVPGADLPAPFPRFEGTGFCPIFRRGVDIS